MLRWQGAAVAGVVAAVVLTALAVLLERHGIETDLADRAAVALEGEATSWASIAVDGRDVSLEGAAPDQEFLDLARIRLSRIFGVRTVEASAAALLPEEAPYVVTLTRQADTVLVAGVAPSDPERRRILARVAATLPTLGTADALELARGMPDKAWTEALAAVMPLAADLANGRVMLKDRVASVEGEAISNAAYDHLRTFDPVLPEGYTFAPAAVTRPLAAPFRLSAERVDGRVTLSGYAPDEETRSRLADGASAGGVLPVDLQVDLASGAPPGFAAAALAGLDFLDLFASGRVDLSDRRLSVSGTAASPEAWRTLNSHLATFRPDGFVVDVDVGLPVVSPFVLTAIRSETSITVTGFSPSSAALEEIRRVVEQVAEGGGAVVETTLAAGAPAEFTAAATFAVRLLEHVGSGTVIVADQRIAVSGIASSSGDLLELEASIALETPDGFQVENNVQPPVVSPYTWSIERTDDSLVVSGFVPSEAVRVAVRDAADDAAGDLAVTDRTALAAGLPDGVDLAAVASFAAAEIALLDEGRVSLVDRTLSMTGETADALAGRSAIEAFETQLPPGVIAGSVSVVIPTPFRFSISRTAERLVVEGAVADADVADRLRQAIGRLFGPLAADVRLTPTADLPPAAEGIALIALRAASELVDGTVSVTDGDVAVNGVALTARSRDRLTDDLAALPDGYSARTTVSAPPPPMAVTPDACQVAIDAAARRVGVSFSDRDDSVSADGAGAVAVLAAAMIGCPGARFAIALGDRAIDDPARLGRRAATLGAALVDEGVPAGAITATAASQGEGLSIRVEGAAMRERRVEPPVFNDILRAPEVDIPATPLPPAPILP